MEEFERALATMDFHDKIAMWFAGKLIEGLPYRIETDNPETIVRARSIAGLLGGSVSSCSPRPSIGCATRRRATTLPADGRRAPGGRGPHEACGVPRPMNARRDELSGRDCTPFGRACSR
jgi:hypothetical protein